MRQLILVALILGAAPAGAGGPTCAEVAEAVQAACQGSAPPERHGSERLQFNEDLCQAAARVAGRACDRGAYHAHYAGACGREAEYTGDVMAEACRLVLYRNPRPHVKLWFKAYDERCQRHARAAEEWALRSGCGHSRGDTGAAARPSPVSAGGAVPPPEAPRRR
jgi:hypothetical protein